MPESAESEKLKPISVRVAPSSSIYQTIKVSMKPQMDPKENSIGLVRFRNGFFGDSKAIERPSKDPKHTYECGIEQKDADFRPSCDLRQLREDGRRWRGQVQTQADCNECHDHFKATVVRGKERIRWCV